MSQQRSAEHFDLSRFVLGYLEHEGSVVAPPLYGVHEALLPDELAAQLRLDLYLRLAFDAEAGADTLRLSVNHPLVETIAERLAQEAGHAQVYINHVRLEKKGLFDVAAKALSFANARLRAMRDGEEQTALHHYLRCNFKATFLSDEKQEQIVSVVLDVQGGHAVRHTTLLERLVSYETEPAFPHLTAARPRWRGAGDAPLAPTTLDALLARAQVAAEAALADRLAALQARTQRFLELDTARLEDYYTSLERDLKQRLTRAETSEMERRSSIEAKIDALRTERSVKLADIQARHQLRVELELINVLITVQPKVLLPVEVGNRRVTITRLAVWDPLLHRLEPLVCDVCGEPGDGLHLCTGGHLAHRTCLAPQCVDCNREYCRLCADQVLTCVVCGRPVCRSSSRTCPECNRSTCAEHQKLCHAADGRPAVLPKAEAPPPPPVAPPPPPKASGKPKAKPAAKPTSARPAPTASAVKLNVEIYEDRPLIVAFVMRSTNRVLAARSFELTPEGIGIECRCEKSPCPAHGWLHRPTGPEAIQEQVQAFLSALRQEYYLPSKRTDYFYILGEQATERQAFILPPIWRDPQKLAQARTGFDNRRNQW
jgi:hypothetical protein